MVPFAHSLAEILRGKAAAAVGRDGRERFHRRSAGGKNIAMGGEPLCLPLVLCFVLLLKSMVQNLHLDARGQSPLGSALRQSLDGFGSAPNENSGVAARPQVAPACNQFEIGKDFRGANDSHRLAGAKGNAICPGPGTRFTIHIHEILLRQRPPTGTLAINAGFGQSRGVLSPGVQVHADREREETKNGLVSWLHIAVRIIEVRGWGSSKQINQSCASALHSIHVP